MRLLKTRWGARALAVSAPRRRRRALLLLLAAAVILPVPVAAHLAPLSVLHPSSPAAADELLAPEDGTLTVARRSYRLALEQSTGRVTVATLAGREYTALPLAMSGVATRPRGSHRVSRRSGGLLESRLLDAAGRVLEEAVLEPSAESFMVRFTARPELLGAGPLRFFHDGVAGIDLTEITGGYTPDPTLPALTARPVVGIAGRTPFAPPPFHIQLHTVPGWLGIGLVEVPAATSMRLDAGGGVSVDYPPALVGAGSDLGAGPPVDGMVRFPEFAVRGGGRNQWSTPGASRWPPSRRGRAPSTPPTGCASSSPSGGDASAAAP
jgi:hypothetical protein